MSKKDYEAVAEMLKHELDLAEGPAERFTIIRITGKIADLFAADNYRFNRSRFLTAVGVED